MNRAKFNEQFNEFKRQSRADGRFDPQADQQNPILTEDTPTTAWDSHYTLYCGWAARRISTSYDHHFDFGSSIYFAAIVSAFKAFTFCDIRPPALPFRDMEERFEDLTHLTFVDNSIDSMSCLHVLEHVGLGRYGDTLDAQGDIKAARELARVLAPGGQFLFAVPMDDPPRITFNSDRLYGYKQVMDLFPTLRLTEFSLVTNEGAYHEHVEEVPLEATAGLKYACGLFAFTK